MLHDPFGSPLDVGWLGDKSVALVDIDTEDDTVVDYFSAWVKQFVADYSCVIAYNQIPPRASCDGRADFLTFSSARAISSA